MMVRSDEDGDGGDNDYIYSCRLSSILALVVCFFLSSASHFAWVWPGTSVSVCLTRVNLLTRVFWVLRHRNAIDGRRGDKRKCLPTKNLRFPMHERCIGPLTARDCGKP